jgi:Rps23 Pro-64 3,4-dihydroxylase Tpa1-like proline 4-hydroxylase
MERRFVSEISSRLLSMKDTLQADFQAPQETKTRHFVIDDLLPTSVANEVFNAFDLSSSDWHRHKSIRETKSTNARIDSLNDIVSEVTDSFHDPKVLHAMGEITGIEGLKADPSLYAGGLSVMHKGDFLNPHIDNSHDADRRRYRRLNLLYYVSPNWAERYGGNFELWDEKVGHPVTIVSKFNRLVVMETTRGSFHSVSPVLVDNPRCCLSNYYFSENSSLNKDYYHVTSFTGRPNQPFRRAIGGVDNFARELLAKLSGFSRGKQQSRNN